MPILHLQKCRSINPLMDNRALKGRFSVYSPPYPRIMGVSRMVMEIYLSFNEENSRQISDGKAPQTTGK